MNELLIHIGYHKTGTTWLQQELFVVENNIFEPISRHYPHKSTLGFKFVYGDDGYLLSPFDENKKKIQKELLLLLKAKQNSKNKIFVMSNERLCGHYQSGGVDAKDIARRLHNFFPNAKIFITIREQKSYILSQYFQYLTYGGIESLKDYMNNRSHKIPSFSPHFHTYNWLIKEYRTLFGKENVLVLPYEMFKSSPKEYIKHLSSFIKRDIQIEDEKFRIKHNLQQHFFTIYYLRKLNFLRYSNVNNYFSKWKNNYTKFLVNQFYHLFNKFVSTSRHQKTKAELLNYIERWVGDKYVESNKELSELIGIDLSKYGYKIS